MLFAQVQLGNSAYRFRYVRHTTFGFCVVNVSFSYHIKIHASLLSLTLNVYR